MHSKLNAKARHNIGWRRSSGVSRVSQRVILLAVGNRRDPKERVRSALRGAGARRGLCFARRKFVGTAVESPGT